MSPGGSRCRSGRARERPIRQRSDRIRRMIAPGARLLMPRRAGQRGTDPPVLPAVLLTLRFNPRIQCRDVVTDSTTAQSNELRAITGQTFLLERGGGKPKVLGSLRCSK